MGSKEASPCLPRKSLVSQSNRTQNHGAESRLTARRDAKTRCVYRRKGLFENARRKPEEATVSRVGSSNFSTSHWNTESYPSFSLSLFLSLQHSFVYFHLSLSLFPFLAPSRGRATSRVFISILIPSSMPLLRPRRHRILRVARIGVSRNGVARLVKNHLGISQCLL